MLPQIDYRQCPLCQELFRIDDLRIHAKSESEELRKYTIEIIKSQHPEWVEEDGACPKCWEYYGKL